MDVKTYQAFATTGIRTEGKGKSPIVGFALGLAGETGEVVDGIKKREYHGRVEEITVEHLIEELGDVMWYLANLASVLGVSLETVMQLNYEKLHKRYAQLYKEEK